MNQVSWMPQARQVQLIAGLYSCRRVLFSMVWLRVLVLWLLYLIICCVGRCCGSGWVLHAHHHFAPAILRQRLH